MVEISLVELQLHVAEALATRGIGVEAFDLLPDGDGGWRIRLDGDDSGSTTSDRKEAARQVETALGQRFRVHRLSRGGAYGG
jgi:hypothetical protein